MKHYRMKDLKDIEIPNNATAFDVLVAVASKLKEIEFPEIVQDSCVSKNTHKNKKLLKKKNESVGVEERKIKEKDSNRDSGKKRKRSDSSVSNVVEELTELPEEFKNAINEKLNGGKEFTGEVKLLAEKTLYKADILDNQGRLLLPSSYMKCHDFLTPDEKAYLETRLVKKKRSYIEVKMIEPSLELGGVKLHRENKCLNYVLNGTWKDIVTRNRLRVGTEVQLWGFRINEELCFALHKLPPKTETS